MSVKATAWAWELDVSDPVERLILVFLCDKGNDDGQGIWPSVQTIAKAVCACERTVQRRLRDLEQQGLIQPDPEYIDSNLLRIDPRYRPKVWRVNLPWSVRGDSQPPLPLSRGDLQSPLPASRGDTDDVSGVTTESPKPLVEPLVDKTSPPRRIDVEQVCSRLRDRITRNGCKPPTITETWRSEARLLLDRDKRPLIEALALIDWCQNDPFWRGNVLSMPTFRRQYDRLRLRSQETGPPGRSAHAHDGVPESQLWML